MKTDKKRSLPKPKTEFGRLCHSYRAGMGVNEIIMAKELKEKHGLLKCDQPKITNYENGTTDPPLEYVLKCIDYFALKERTTDSCKFLLSALKSSKKITLEHADLKAIPAEKILKLISCVVFYERKVNCGVFPYYTFNSIASSIDSLDIE